MRLTWDAGKRKLPDMPEWTYKILNLPMESKSFKLYVISPDGTRQVKIGEYENEDDAIRAGELEVIKRNG